MTTQLSLLDTPKPPLIDAERDRPFVGMVRAFKGQPASQIVELGIEAYRRRHGGEPVVVLTSYADAAALEGFTALQVRATPGISPGCFYLGREGSA